MSDKSKTVSTWIGLGVTILIVIAGAMWNARSYADDKATAAKDEAVAEVKAHEERAAATRIESDQRTQDDLNEIKAMIRALTEKVSKQGEDISAIKATQTRRGR